ncbi:MAG: hypothetical protein QGG69_01375 [Kiritimatiellia bacterium]|jgi:hypothetical protein|nr:hypothetical protein [Kiritimatiellia bacterium]
MGALKHIINLVSAPQVSFLVAAIAFFFVFPPTAGFERWNRRLRLNLLWTVRGGILLHALVIGGFFVSTLDPNFRAIVAKPDNVPIALLLFGTLFFLWYAMKQAVDNDQRLASDQKPNEYTDPSEPKILVWPDLVYIELIAAVLCMAALIFWSIALEAPLEQPANPTLSPNPAKAPWYFLGLQEMLVYFDPWLAGVVFPVLIIFGLMALPYIDTAPEGSGYYSYSRRKLFISLFLFGWLLLWVYLIIVGAFMRGPNWNFFGPYEEWDIHKVVPLTNINFSALVWVKLLNRPLPDNIIVREIFGIVLLGIHFLVVPPLLGVTVLKKFYSRMGNVKYAVFMFLSMAALTLPIKMFLRWTINLKYLVAIPGWFNL